jgi:hypothetical protein
MQKAALAAYPESSGLPRKAALTVNAMNEIKGWLRCVSSEFRMAQQKQKKPRMLPYRKPALIFMSD